MLQLSVGMLNVWPKDVGIEVPSARTGSFFWNSRLQAPKLLKGEKSAVPTSR
jgi:hypothetical protein